MQRQILFAVLASFVLVGATASRSWAQPSSAVCASGGEGYPEICVRFDNLPTAPIEDTDFMFQFTDPDNPSVVLLRGDDGQGTIYEWRAWSHDDQDDPANIGSITSPGAYDYHVKVFNPDDDPGAADIASMVLDPAGDHHSSLDDGEISGDLTGPMKLVKDSGGDGGDIFGVFTIGGNASGSISVPKITGAVVIEGDASARITVSDKLHGGVLWIKGDALSTAYIQIEDMESDGPQPSAVAINRGLAGDLVLESGLPEDQWIEVGLQLTSTGSIDLKGQDVAGELALVYGGAGTIANGGAVTSTGIVYPAYLGTFTGTATFDSVAQGGLIEAHWGNLGGDLFITNNMAGRIEVDDDLLSTGVIWVGGDVTANGVISIGDECLGDLIISNDLLGQVNISTHLAGDVYVKGDVILGAIVDIGGELKSTGRVLVIGLCDGLITVGQETEALSLIHILEGIDDYGSIVINQDEGIYDANGTIQVGPASWEIEPPSVTFDGSIAVNDNGSGRGGDLNGAINVVGCHASPADLNICIDGDGEENITITQTDCANQVEAVCRE